ncbi:uncharacterized protein LOC123207486 isoform X2 [Mangifera indica]|nr:uncharacterized protein LOC123207486 isoform X2 [Mangifera indica]
MNKEMSAASTQEDLVKESSIDIDESSESESDPSLRGVITENAAPPIKPVFVPYSAFPRDFENPPLSQYPRHNEGVYTRTCDNNRGGITENIVPPPPPPRSPPRNYECSTYARDFENPPLSQFPKRNQTLSTQTRDNNRGVITENAAPPIKPVPGPFHCSAHARDFENPPLSQYPRHNEGVYTRTCDNNRNMEMTTAYKQDLVKELLNDTDESLKLKSIRGQCSIYRVPKKIRSVNEQVYTPEIGEELVYSKATRQCQIKTGFLIYLVQ